MHGWVRAGDIDQWGDMHQRLASCLAMAGHEGGPHEPSAAEVAREAEEVKSAADIMREAEEAKVWPQYEQPFFFRGQQLVPGSKFKETQLLTRLKEKGYPVVVPRGGKARKNGAKKVSFTCITKEKGGGQGRGEGNGNGKGKEKPTEKEMGTEKEKGKKSGPRTTFSASSSCSYKLTATSLDDEWTVVNVINTHTGHPPPGRKLANIPEAVKADAREKLSLGVAPRHVQKHIKETHGIEVNTRTLSNMKAKEKQNNSTQQCGTDAEQLNMTSGGRFVMLAATHNRCFVAKVLTCNEMTSEIVSTTTILFVPGQKAISITSATARSHSLHPALKQLREDNTNIFFDVYHAGENYGGELSSSGATPTRSRTHADELTGGIQSRCVCSMLI